MHGRKNSFLSLQTPALNKIMSHRSGMTVFLFLIYPMRHRTFWKLRMPVWFPQTLSIQAISKTREPWGNVKGQPLYQGASLPYRACTLEVYWIKGQSFAPRLAWQCWPKKNINGYLINLSLRNQPRGSKKNGTKQPGNARPGMSEQSKRLCRKQKRGGLFYTFQHFKNWDLCITQMLVILKIHYRFHWVKLWITRKNGVLQRLQTTNKGRTSESW